MWGSLDSHTELRIWSVDPNFEKDDATASDGLIIHDMLTPNPFFLKTVNNFHVSPPFGLYDIFNYSIYLSTDHNKQGLAAYNLFEDYRLFDDGYVESLLTSYSKQEGIRENVTNAHPFMEVKTDEGKEFYDLWFIVKGRGSNLGSVLQAKCKCKGSRNGECKHIAAAMYCLEDLLNAQGKDSVTSGPCICVKKPRANTKSWEVKDLVIRKWKNTKTKALHTYPQYTDRDVRAPEDRNPKDEAYLRQFTEKCVSLKLMHLQLSCP